MTTQMNTAAEIEDISALLASLTEAEKEETAAEAFTEIESAAVEDDFDEAALLADLGSIGASATL